MSYQYGDGQVVFAGKSYGLRLTMGVLAELDTCLSVNGPQELSLRLRLLGPSDGRVLLTCLMRPCFPEGDAHMSAADFTEADIAAAMPAICRLFEEAFSDARK